MKNKYIPTETRDNTANDKEIQSNPMDEKERPSTDQVINLVSNLSHRNHQNYFISPFLLRYISFWSISDQHIGKLCNNRT